MDDPHAAVFDELFRQLLEGSADSAPEVRRAVARNQDVPADLRQLVDKVHKHAYRVTDEDVAQLQAEYGDDRAFEIIVAAALGAARKRLMAGLAALEDA
jgi:alkylhydroperoxidase family enzyme